MKNFSEQDYQQIDRYLGKQLSSQERLTFEERLLHDPELAEEVQWVRKLYVNYEHVALRGKVFVIQEKLAKQGVLATRPVRFWTNFRMAMAASVLLAMVAGAWYWQTQQSSNLGQIAVQSPVVESGPLSEPDSGPDKGSGTLPPVDDLPPTDELPLPDALPTANPRDLARNALAQPPKRIGAVPPALTAPVADLERGRPDKAIAALKQPLSPVIDPTETPEFGSTQEPATEAAETMQYRLFYLGLSYLRDNQPRLALSPLSEVTIRPLSQSAEWYKSLCYLQLNQTDAALRLLDRIRNQSGHPYRTEADELATALAAQTPN